MPAYRIQRARPGDRQLRASDWNTIAAAVEEFLRRTGAEGPRYAREAGAIILVRNASGAARDRGEVLALTAPTILPSASADAWLDRVCMDAALPTAAGQPFAVLLDPLPALGIGRAVVGGAAAAKVNVSDAGHGYADSANGSANLASAAAGPARIVWKAASTGLVDALVVLGAGAAAAPAPSGGGAFVARVVTALGSAAYSVMEQQISAYGLLEDRTGASAVTAENLAERSASPGTLVDLGSMVIVTTLTRESAGLTRYFFDHPVYARYAP